MADRLEPVSPHGCPAGGTYRILGDAPASESELLRDELNRVGWRPTDRDDWDLLWSVEIQPDEEYERREGRLVNHFPGIAPLIFKDELALFLGRADVGQDFHPRTFPMPEQLDTWRRAARADPTRRWIAKPRWSGGGTGVHLIDDPTTADLGGGWLVQEYIDEPLVLPGQRHKHGLRVYALITALDPLRVLVHRSGLVKYASRAYSRDPDERADRSVHLTNAVLPERIAGDVTPTASTTLAQFLGAVRTAGHDDRRLWQRIVAAIKATTLALQPPIRRLSGEVAPDLNGCFELVVFDVLVDRDLRPWLLECNLSPALGVSSPGNTAEEEVRRTVKRPIVRDLLLALGGADVSETRWEVVV